MRPTPDADPEPTRPGLAGRARRALGRHSDEELMSLVQAGDLEAFECLVDRYKVAVYSLCRHLLGNPEDAEEASQDTFLKVFRARDRFDPERRFQPWVLKIAGNAARDLLRRRRPREVVNSEVLEAEAERLGGGDGDELRRRLDAEEIRRVLRDLSEETRLPLVLKYLHGMKNREVAATLGISLSSLKVRLGRAREILHARIVRRWEP